MAIDKTPVQLSILVQKLNRSTVDEIKDMFESKIIGAGSYKTVYDLGNNFILKVSEYPEDTTEIKKEIEIKKCAGSKYLTKILAYDKKAFHWLITEKVKTVSYNNLDFFVETIKKLLKGSDFLQKSIWTSVRYSNEEEKVNISELQGETFIQEFAYYLHEAQNEKDIRSRWLQGLIDVIKTCGIDPRDLYHRNWGIRPQTNEPVILDYGFEPIKFDT